MLQVQQYRENRREPIQVYLEPVYRRRITRCPYVAVREYVTDQFV